MENNVSNLIEQLQEVVLFDDANNARLYLPVEKESGKILAWESIKVTLNDDLDSLQGMLNIVKSYMSDRYLNRKKVVYKEDVHPKLQPYFDQLEQHFKDHGMEWSYTGLKIDGDHLCEMNAKKLASTEILRKKKLKRRKPSASMLAEKAMDEMLGDYGN